MKNKLFKLENTQGTKQAAITMKKNRLFKQDNNQSKNQVSITMNLPNAQNTKRRTTQYTPQEHILNVLMQQDLKLYLNKLNNFNVTNCYHLLKNFGTFKAKT